MRIFLGWVWIVFPGCWALFGPPEVRGPLGGDLTVQCWYGKGYENYIKYWYRGTTRTSCLIVVKTESEAMVKSDRVSIRDIHTFCMFIVTMRNLTVEDSTTYWCGIDRPVMDLMFSVEVNVLPAVPTSPTPAPGKEPTFDAVSNKPPFTWTVPTVAEPNSTVHRSDPSPSTRDPVLQILIPCLLLVLLLILLTVIVFRRTSQRRAKALKRAPGHREKNFHPYRLAPGGTKFSATSDAEPGSKAAVCPTMEETPDPAADEFVYENAPYDTQVSGSMEEVVPDTVTSPISHTQNIYANMKPNPRSRTTPSRPPATPGKNASR